MNTVAWTYLLFIRACVGNVEFLMDILGSACFDDTWLLLITAGTKILSAFKTLLICNLYIAGVAPDRPCWG